VEARELYTQMPEKNVVAMTAMITGYCKEGKMEDARVLFDEIQCKDDVSWNAMITGMLSELHFLSGETLIASCYS
jgi:pentatricopeptide repeat protein